MPQNARQIRPMPFAVETGDTLPADRRRRSVIGDACLAWGPPEDAYSSLDHRTIPKPLLENAQATSRDRSRVAAASLQLWVRRNGPPIEQDSQPGPLEGPWARIPDRAGLHIPVGEATGGHNRNNGSVVSAVRICQAGFPSSNPDPLLETQSGDLLPETRVGPAGHL